jgi:threonine/homoserine/homoserine lactone efflux protein
LWALNCGALVMIERCVFILLTIALVASVGGFFLYVPILPNLAVTVMLGGLCAMFWLGVRVGRGPQEESAPQSAPSDGSQLSLS